MKDLICVKCGSPVVVYDGDALVMDKGRRFTAYCGAMGRLHGFAEGPTGEAALAAYAKDQEWGMQQIENQCLLYEQNELLKEQVRLLKERINWPTQSKENT